MPLSSSTSRSIPVVQLMIASTAFSSGLFAVLETFPRQPLFDVQFIYSTLWFLAGAATVFGLIGLFLTL